MKPRRLALITLLLTLAVWLPMSWPLPARFADAMPHGAVKRAAASGVVQPMTPGDHLQFAYHLWLFSDFLSGRTPFFYNLYEFNTGNDAERHRPGSYYLPFSLAFAVFYWLGGHAFAWNAICFLALWLSGYGAWRLARRYTESDLVAGVASLLALLSPYHWSQLFGGSPAGFGMAFIPLLLLGLDRAVRDESPAGGLLAGAALLFATTSDTHAMFFATLMTPCWCLVAFTQRASFRWRAPRDYLRIALALAPTVALAAAAYLLTQSGTKNIQSSHAAGGRRISEVALFSPKPEGLWAWQETGVSHQIYLGYIVLALGALGLALLLAQALRRRDRAAWQRLALLVLVALGATGIVLLALGPFSPFEGRAFTAARKFIPPYTMIRQPAKIFLLLPPLLAIGAALSLGAARARLSARAGAILALAVGAGLYAEYFFQSALLVSRVDRANAAYAAAAADARARERDPRALVVPLWPGDSHYASVYQHFASLYRIRMINGYRPFVPAAYITDVFDRFRSANLGVLDDDQLDNLLGRGIDLVLLHEDLFPEKVSPFPVAATLRALLNNPRLAPIAQDGPVWVFRIQPAAEQRSHVARNWVYLFPARRLELERQVVRGAKSVPDATAGAGAFVPLTGEASARSNPLFAPALPDLRWSFRVRGKGILSVDRRVADTSVGEDELMVDSAEWVWLDAAAGEPAGAQDVQFKIMARDGHVDVDMALLVAGAWRPLAAGETISLPAPCFFHAGSIDLQTDRVALRKDRDRIGVMFYGPKLPLTPGRYRIAPTMESDAPAGTRLGTWVLSCPEGREIGQFAAVAGAPVAGEFAVPANLPFLLVFVYDGLADLALGTVAITRLD